MTVAAFVLEGNELKATAIFEGPIAPADKIRNGGDLKAATDEFERKYAGGRHNKDVIRNVEVVDFEDLSYEDDEFYEDDDDIVNMDNPDNIDEEEIEARKERKKRRRELEKKRREEKDSLKKQRAIRDEGDPFEKTFKVPQGGWYRFCVQGTWHQVVAELDMRSESELGGLDEDGAVLTFEEKAWLDEEKFMEQDTAVEEGIKDEDFESTKDKLKTLRRLLADIQTKQLQERHRLVVHSQTNEHSHSRMVLGSLLETIVFMVVTGVQIMTIRRWFKGAPVLG